MRVVVTGGAGYIGSVVTECLLRQGHRVLVVDNLSKGHRDAVPADAEFVQLGIDDANLGPVLSEFKADAAVHMAAHSLVGESTIKPEKYYQNNVAAGLAMLDIFRRRGISRLVFSSTAAVYGEPAKQPIDESDPLRPTNPYGETKLAFERALYWHARAHGFSSVSLRYFNAAGATLLCGERHEPETHLIPNVLAAAERGAAVTIFGGDYPTPDGTCVRDYIHVADLAHAHVLALCSLREPGMCDAYNLGCGGRGYSVRDVIATAERITGRPIRVSVEARRPGDPAMLVAAADKIQRKLGWSPRHDLDEMLGSAWRWMQRNRVTPLKDVKRPYAV